MRNRIKKFFSRTPVEEPTSVFGKSINELALNSDGIPIFFAIVCSNIKNNVTHRGIFRKCGDQSQVDLIGKLAMNSNFQLPPNTDIDTQTSFLKQWLRELPDPILLPLIVKKYFKSDIPNTGQITIQNLPIINRKCIAILFNIIKLISNESSVNLMSMYNLNVCLIPSLTQTAKTPDYGSNFTFQSFFESVIQFINSEGNDFDFKPAEANNVFVFSDQKVRINGLNESECNKRRAINLGNFNSRKKQFRDQTLRPSSNSRDCPLNDFNSSPRNRLRSYPELELDVPNQHNSDDSSCLHPIESLPIPVYNDNDSPREDYLMQPGDNNKSFRANENESRRHKKYHKKHNKKRHENNKNLRDNSNKKTEDEEISTDEIENEKNIENTRKNDEYCQNSVHKNTKAIDSDKNSEEINNTKKKKNKKQVENKITEENQKLENHEELPEEDKKESKDYKKHNKRHSKNKEKLSKETDNLPQNKEEAVEENTRPTEDSENPFEINEKIEENEETVENNEESTSDKEKVDENEKTTEDNKKSIDKNEKIEENEESIGDNEESTEDDQKVEEKEIIDENEELTDDKEKVENKLPAEDSEKSMEENQNLEENEEPTESNEESTEDNKKIEENEKTENSNDDSCS